MDDHRTASSTTGTAPVGSERSPRRVLVVSADMGGGHHATAAAVEESARRIWPGCEIRRIDALDVMGSWVGDAFRRTYVSNVESTPWLYEFFYSSLWRHRWFAVASKRFVGSWCGRRLVRRIDEFDPDMVLSTYPLGTAGLAWLIRHRGMTLPVGSWVSDYAPHPFWVYPEIAINYLVDEAAVPAARCAEPGGHYRVSALPVVARFGPADRGEARRRLGLRADATVVLIGCGSYAFGDVVSLVRTSAEVSERIQVVAACGRNDEIRARIAGLGFPAERVVPMGWTTEMPTVTAAADLVIGNAGGATALEAIASGVPVVLTEPIAAHGAANATLIAVAGTAELCSDEPALAAYLKTVVTPPAQPGAPPAAPAVTALPALERPAGGPPEVEPTAVASPAAEPPALEPPAPAPPAGRPDRVAALDGDVAAVAGLANGARSSRSASWPMRASDAFFCHVETTGATQELGVILQLGLTDAGTAPALDAIRASMQRRSSLPSVRRVVVRHRPGWRLARTVDAAEHVDDLVLTDGGGAAAWDAAGDFFSHPLPAGRPAWQMRLIRGWSDDTSLFAIKMHHSQADGMSALGLLDRLLDPDDADPLPERRSIGDPADAGRASPQTLGRGLMSLAGRGFAPRHPLGTAPMSARRQLVAGSVPWSSVRAAAAAAQASVTETSIALGAHVLAGILTPTGLVRGGVPLRTMIPVAMRPARLDREFGNWTGSLAADLDMSALDLPGRIVAVRDELRRRHRAGEAPAAAAVMALAGSLPSPVHRAFTRAVYQRRFFSTVVSFMPGARRGRWLAGAPVTGMTPVLPLAPRVPVTLGMILTDGRLDVGVMLDGALGLPREALQQAVQATLAEIR